MVSFSIKPGDQTDETESPNLNLVNKTELKQQEIKELLAGSYKFLAKVLPSQNLK